MVMSDEEFAEKSDVALRITRAIMSELSLGDFGLDDVAVFNVVLKAMVTENV